jgi:hypothetical protein
MQINKGEKNMKLRAKPTGMNPVQQAKIFETHSKTIKCDQIYRELSKNALEAIEKKREIDPNFKGYIQMGRLDLPGLENKMSCMDNAIGMPKKRVVDLVNNLAETLEQSPDGNFGYGTKPCAYARNKEGIQYQTWRHNESEGSYVRIHKQPEGFYGAEPFEETNDHRLDLTLEQRPDFIIQHGGSGTITSLLGNKKNEDTTKMPEDYSTNSLLCGRLSEDFWLLAKLNCTYFEIPNYVHFVCKTTERWNNRQVRGHKYYLDYYSKPENRGTLNLTNAKLYWWIIEHGDKRDAKKPAQDTNTTMIRGQLSVMHKREIIRIEYDRTGCKNPLRDWGLTFSHKKVVLIIEPLNHQPDEKRQTLHGPDGVEYRDKFPLWKEEFQTKMPSSIFDLEKKLMEENTERQTDLTSLFRKISRDLKQNLDSEKGQEGSVDDFNVMIGGIRDKSGEKTSNTEGEDGKNLKDKFGKDPYRASIKGEDKRKRTINTSLNMCPKVLKRTDLEDYELDYNYDMNELSFNMNLKLIDDYLKSVNPSPVQKDLARKLLIEQLIRELVTRIAYTRGREMGLSEEDKKNCLSGHSLLMSIQDKWTIVEKIKKGISTITKDNKDRTLHLPFDDSSIHKHNPDRYAFNNDRR